MKLAIFACSRRGCETARKAKAALCGAEDQCRCYAPEKYGEFLPVLPPYAQSTGPVFAWADALVFVGTADIAVRSIAPHVRDRRAGPAVVCVDELGKYAISLLSGHTANALTERLAAALGAVAVVTTAADISEKFSPDAWATRAGVTVTNRQAAEAVSAAILEGPVPLDCDFPLVGELPSGVVAGDKGPVGICVSWKRKTPFAETLLLAPPVLHLGLGCRRGTPADQFGEAVEAVLEENGIHPAAIKCAASIDLKQDEAGLLAFCESRGWPLAFYSAGELRAAEGEFTFSERVLRVTGVDNVCERAAMIGAQRLLVRKTIHSGVSIAVAAERWEARF